jgi:hypothetical protein
MTGCHPYTLIVQECPWHHPEVLRKACSIVHEPTRRIVRNRKRNLDSPSLQSLCKRRDRTRRPSMYFQHGSQANYNMQLFTRCALSSRCRKFRPHCFRAGLSYRVAYRTRTEST